MGFLAGKKILITGMLSNRSIAYGVARACQREGATLAFTYVNDELKDRVVEDRRRIRHRRRSCPATSRRTTTSTRCSRRSGASGAALDGLLHSIAFAPREALAGDFLEGLSRAAFATAHDMSSSTASRRSPRARGR